LDALSQSLPPRSLEKDNIVNHEFRAKCGYIRLIKTALLQIGSLIFNHKSQTFKATFLLDNPQIHSLEQVMDGDANNSMCHWLNK
jgi:hypothetical protein